MAIEESSLYEDIIRLTDGPEYGTRKIFECTLIVDDFQVKVMSINSFVFNRDYKRSYGDSIVAEVMVPMGTYTTKIYPQRHRLKAQITSTIVDSRGDKISESEGCTTALYRATIIDSKNPSMVNVNEESESPELGDISTLYELSLQLTDNVVETIRQCTLQTIIRDSDLESTVKVLLKGDLFTDDSLAKAEGVIMTPPDNSKLYKQIIIPPNLSVIEIIDWLQNHYGVYNSNIGVFLQNKYWYVFPLLQTNKFKEDSTSVTIVSLPPSKMPGSEKTFDFMGNHLIILATSDTDQVDNSDSEQRNYGNGLRYINADRVIDDFSETTEGKTVIHKKDNIVEFKTIDRLDRKNYIPFLKDIATVNHAKTLSLISKNRTNLLTVTWENSIPDLLKPGMMVRYVYREGLNTKLIMGVLVNVYHRYISVDPGILQSIHSAASIISILVESDILEEEV